MDDKPKPEYVPVTKYTNDPWGYTALTYYEALPLVVLSEPKHDQETEP